MRRDGLVAGALSFGQIENTDRQDVAKEWTSLIVCKDTCFDPRPPQLDPPNVYPEGLPLPDIRPRPPNTPQRRGTRSGLVA